VNLARHELQNSSIKMLISCAIHHAYILNDYSNVAIFKFAKSQRMSWCGLYLHFRSIPLTDRYHSSINDSPTMRSSIFVVLTRDQSERNRIESPRGCRSFRLFSPCEKDAVARATTYGIENSLTTHRHWHSGTSSWPKTAHLWPSKRQQIKGWIHV